MTPEQILLQELADTWHSTIPLSAFMQICPRRYDGIQFEVSAPLEPNINLHHTMFAGSIYTLMTLTGWGMLWLKQREAVVEGSIVLADANIRYHAPVTSAPLARVRWPGGDLSALAGGKRVKQSLTVELICGETLCASFSGLYVSLPGH
ncbi:thioesterase domain-containing protein [Shewanella sp. FJAT-52076]|uniref:thioesterase domain-containing protein n=1 Tax=Shewanella sp. FJAT-52076 TaxID=2864202 RepID=UPI001C65611F|nr:thioesterase domain-containing protein [Shewanella sp. FJAT-52076]QYJ75156.1 thioesterase domain-containing protein [Shewanella sp. FJAT-52076]